MITLELSRRNWNTKYLQYDPAKWVVGLVPFSRGINIEALTHDAIQKSSYGFFDRVDLRTSPIPSYVPKSDITVWA